MSDELWKRVDDLVDRAPDLSDLREHRLELLAARRWRALGRPVPEELREKERVAAVMSMAVAPLLAEIRAAVDGPMLLLKGPELAARYPGPTLRAYRDLDVLVPDARDAHAALRRAGFVEVGDPEKYVDLHHLRPLLLPPLPLVVEIHSVPKWIGSLQPPPTSELIAAAVPSSLEVEGVSTLRPDHHALVLAAHSWAHEPLRRISELVDIAAMSEGVDRDALRQLAERWGMARVWHTTIGAVDALFSRNGRSKPVPLRLWARNLPDARSRTVFESHVERWLAGFWGLPIRPALGVAGASAVRAFVPADDETWREKLARTRLAFRHASTARSEHDRELEHRRRR